ncbi:MAG: DUF3352 domain-containing protein [Planctomycetia bacterium]|nr:DUF3352 domain-containing protein [Planctomycetia bacterium]
MKRRGEVAVRLGLACLTVLLFAARASADRPSATRLLPDKTLAFISIPSTPDLIDRYKEASLYRMLQDEQLKPLVRQLYGSAAEAFGRIQDRVGLPLDEILKLPQGELCFAVVPAKEGPPAMVFMFEVLDHLPSAQKLVDRADEELTSNGATKSTEVAGDVKLTIYELPGNAPFPLVEFEKDGTIVIATNVDVAKDLIAKWNGGEGATLADNKEFTAIMNRCKGTKEEEPQVIFYVDPIDLAKAIVRGNFAAQAAMAVLPALGLDGLQGVGGSLIFATEEYDMISHFHVLLEEPRSGVLKIVALGEGDTTPESWVPKDVVSYTTFFFKVQTAWDEGRKLYDSFRGEGAFNADFAQQAGERLGIDLEKDVIGALDGRFTYLQWVEPPARFNSQALLIGAKLKDAKTFQATFDKLIGQLPAPMTKQTFGGVPYYRFEVFGRAPNQPPPGEGPVQIQLRAQEPCVAIVGDYVVFSDSVKLLERAIVTSTDASGSLAGELDFKLISSKIERHSGGKPAMLQFARPEESLRMFYEMANSKDTRRTLSELAGENEFFAALDKALKENPLPPFAAIAKYLAPTGAMVTNDETGIHFMSFGLRRK